ncbi:hypothetical protein J7L48_10200 [bacterium]|nr:hypothetical protein [bacterium]
MKKILFLSLIGVLFLLANCNLPFLQKKSADQQFLANEFQQGKPYSLDLPDNLNITDIRDFIIGDNYNYILSGKGKSLIVFDMLGSPVLNKKTFGNSDNKIILEYPQAMCYIPTNNVFVIFDSILGKLFITNPSGRLLKTIYEFDYNMDDEAEYPTYLAYDKERGHILLVDSYEGNVRGLNLNGDTEFTIGSKDELKLPQCITVDDDGRYYVGCEGDIKVFDASGKYIYSFSKMGKIPFKKASDIALWRSRFIVVTDTISGYVYIFSRSGKFLYKTNSATQDTKFIKPYLLYVDASQKLFILDYSNNKIYQY